MNKQIFGGFMYHRQTFAKIMTRPKTRIKIQLQITRLQFSFAWV